MFNWNKKENNTTKVKLQGCLDVSQDTKALLCGHGNHADSCYLCEKAKSKSSLNSIFYSNLEKTINLDE